MLIFAEKITPRLRYIAELFFTDPVFTSNAAEFAAADLPKINYSPRKFAQDEFQVVPHGLLFDNRVVAQNIQCFQWQQQTAFFAGNGDIPFDIFAASFFLVSRYEEYLPHQRDSYGRFAHTESLAWKQGFLHLPLVNIWMQLLYQQLRQRFPAFQPPDHRFQLLPTYDIDIAYAFRGRGIIRKLMALWRRQSLSKDPLDVYDWLDGLHADYQLEPRYFFLVTKRRSRYDKNVSPRSGIMRQLIRRLSTRYPLGLHPSWQSFHEPEKLRTEKTRLEKLAGRAVRSSRQHYIRFTLPHTFRSLIDAGIREDYSMGYGSINGFRASITTSFFWYDLMREEKTALLLHPFCYMEANSFFEQHLSADAAADELQAYCDVVRQVNGQLITVFHNHFLTEEPQWQPWRTMYAAFLQRNA